MASRAIEILSEACSRLRHTTRKMFGGVGFFAPNGGMFAGVLGSDEVMLKLADADARTALLAEGGQPWTYDGKSKPTTMPSWIVIPESFYDDEETLQRWVTRAHRLVPAKKTKAKAASPKTPAKKTKRSR